MKVISKERALVQLRRVKDNFRELVSAYEKNARPCSSCGTPGACCLDAHFVNVRISRLEAEAIVDGLSKLSSVRRAAVRMRIDDSIETYRLYDRSNTTYACPLYESEAGCLVHESGTKPLPCIHHACYDKKEDLPPDDLLETAELQIDVLNRQAFRTTLPLLPLPVAVQAALERSGASAAATGSGDKTARRTINAITTPAKNHPIT